MAVNPGEKRYSEVSLQVNNSLLTGSRTVTATMPGGAYPAANLPSGTSSVNVTIAESTSGVSPPAGVWGIAVVEDNVDVSPNYTVTGSVLSWIQIGTGGSLSASVSVSVPRRGCFRLVLTVGDTAARSQNGTGVNTGGTSVEFHRNSDAIANGSRGGLAIVNTTAAAIAGYNWRNTKLASRSYSTAGNLRYAQTTTITLGFDTGTYINPKPIKVGLRTLQSDGTMQDGIYRPTPNTSGSATTVTIQCDTDFAAVSTNYFLHIALGDAMGESIPANERPDLLTSGTITGTTTSQRHWLQFDNGSQTLAGFTGSGNNRIVSNTEDKTLASGITIYEDAGVTPGAHSFADAGYTIAQDIFKRQGGGNTTDAVPYLESYVYDAYGAPLVSTNVRAEIRRQTDSGSDNGQNLTTDANGRVRWNYTVSTTHAAFNRYVKPGASRSAGSHATTGPDDPDTPPSTFSVGNPDWPTDYPGPYPAYPRRVFIRGNAFSGVKEPSDQVNDVFGINSEFIAEGMWTGTLAAIATETVLFVDRVTGVGTTTTLVSGTVTAAEGHFYLVNVARRNTAASVNSVTGLGLTWTLVDTASGADGRVDMWKGEGTPTADGTVTVEFSEAPTNAVMGVSRYSGVLLSAPIQEEESTTDTTDTYADSLNGSNNGMIVVAISAQNQTHTPGSSSIERTEVPQGTGSNKATLVTTTRELTADGAAAYSGSFSGTLGWGIVAATLRPNVTPLDSNGVPLGAGNREQPLGAGSLKAKLTTFIDEGTITVIDKMRHNIKDIAGRNVVLTGGAEIYLRRAEWNLTLNSVSDSGTNLNDASTALEEPLTYKSGNSSLDSISAPSDPSSVAYYQGYADTTGQRNTFTLAVDHTNVGFTGDTGMFGYFRQSISFFAIDLAISCVVTPEVTQSDPTLTRRVGVKVIRVTTDDQYVGVAPDENPSYAVFGLSNDGTQVLLDSGSALATAVTSDFYVDIVIPTGFFAVKLVAFAKVNGSRTPGGDGTPIQIGFQFDATGFATGINFK